MHPEPPPHDLSEGADQLGHPLLGLKGAEIEKKRSFHSQTLQDIPALRWRGSPKAGLGDAVVDPGDTIRRDIVYLLDPPLGMIRVCDQVIGVAGREPGPFLKIISKAVLHPLWMIFEDDVVDDGALHGTGLECGYRERRIDINIHRLLAQEVRQVQLLERFVDHRRTNLDLSGPRWIKFGMRLAPFEERDLVTPTTTRHLFGKMPGGSPDAPHVRVDGSAIKKDVHGVPFTLPLGELEL